jgi:hypothetical protein
MLKGKTMNQEIINELERMPHAQLEQLNNQLFNRINTNNILTNINVGFISVVSMFAIGQQKITDLNIIAYLFCGIGILFSQLANNRNIKIKREIQKILSR